MMINKTNISLGVALATLTMAGALVSPQAAAGSKARHHAEVAGMSSKVDALEAQLRAMQDELSSLRAASSQTSAEAEKVQELDQWMASVKSAPVHEAHHDNTIFFRGGFARNDSKRNDLLTGNQVGGSLIPNALGGGLTNKDGWYTGAGFDFSLTDDVWGAMDDTQVLAELMFEYKNFGAKNFEKGLTGQNPLCTTIDSATATGIAGTNACNGVTVSQFSLTAAPKIKFMKDSAFRPWIIPIGLGIHVISPPSNGVTVLNPGMMFAAGADYKLWKDIYVGADVRYHLTGRSVDGVNTNGLTAGGYLGIGF